MFPDANGISHSVSPFRFTARVHEEFEKKRDPSLPMTGVVAFSPARTDHRRPPVLSIAVRTPPKTT